MHEVLWTMNMKVIKVLFNETLAPINRKRHFVSSYIWSYGVIFSKKRYYIWPSILFDFPHGCGQFPLEKKGLCDRWFWFSSLTIMATHCWATTVSAAHYDIVFAVDISLNDIWCSRETWAKANKIIRQFVTPFSFDIWWLALQRR